MNKQTAKQLARRISQDKAVRVTGTRQYDPDCYALDCVDTTTGIPFVVREPEEWEQRCAEADLYDQAYLLEASPSRHDWPRIAEQFMAQWLTPAEIAAATGTAESTWRNKAAAGEIPGVIKKGKQWLIPRAWIRAQGYDV